MSRFVVDAATLVHLVDTGLTVDGGHRLVAPTAVRSQALDLLLRDVRDGRRTEAEALAAHERITGIRIRLLGDRVSRRTAWQIAREQGWESVRDAEYIAITRLQADALATVDEALAAAARGLVEVVGVRALVTPG